MRSSAFQLSDIAADRRVLARDAAMTLGKTLLEMVNDLPSVRGVSIEHSAHAVTKIANGTVLNTDDGDSVRLRVSTQFGHSLPVDVSINQLDTGTIRKALAHTATMTSRSNVVVADDPDDEARSTYGPQPFPPVSLWHDSTIRAMDTVRGDVIPAVVDQLRAAKMSGAATVGLAARSVLYLYKMGLTAFAEETDSEVTVTARTLDGATSGWSGQANRDWSKNTPAAIVAQAMDIANRGRDAVALEPGRRTVILGPAAVAQLVGEMARTFSFAHAILGWTPFSSNLHDPRRPRTKLGQRVFDPRIMMVSDPADPDGGYAPFFEWDSLVELSGISGFPTPTAKWIDHGVLTALARRVSDSIPAGLTPADLPRSVRLFASPGTATATVDEMIANCEEGVYVRRFSGTRMLETKSATMTGVTRDGCFLIKRGKITKPVKNFRFLESPIFAFNALEMIGEPERVAFGYNAPTGRTEWRRWPNPPVIVPPMMIRDFNLVSLSDAV